MLTPFKRSQINSLRLTMSASVGTRFISVAAQDHLQWEAIFLRIHLIKIHFLSQVQNSSEHFKKLFHEEFFMRLFFTVQVREVLRNVLNMRREIQFLRVLRSTFHCQSLLIFRDHMIKWIICGIYNQT